MNGVNSDGFEYTITTRTTNNTVCIAKELFLEY